MSNQLPSNRLLLSIREAADQFDVCERTIWALTQPRGPIPCVKLGRLVKYDPRDLVAYIDAAKVGGAAHV
jgi:hypothetical protein